MINEVYWYTLRRPRPHVLMHDLEADIAIVGGGMAGLMCAEALRKAGASVVVLEKEFCGGGASGKSSGFITPDSELELSHLIKRFGHQDSRSLWEFADSGVERIRSAVLDLGVECDYQVQDSLFVSNSRRGAKQVENENEARLSAGYQSELYDKASLLKVVNSRGYYNAVRYSNTFGINSYLFCQNFKEYLESHGVKIYEHTPVNSIDARGGFLNANGFQVRAQKIILCTDYKIPEFQKLEASIHRAQTFLAITRPLKDFQVEQIFPSGPMMVWDTDLTYHYFRLTGDSRLLVGASNVLYTYGPQSRFATKHISRKIGLYLKEKFPKLSLDLEYIWPGMIGVSKDFIPYAARDASTPNLYYAGAAAGLPWAAALGAYIADKIISGRTDYDAFFSPSRRTPVNNRLQKLISKPLGFAISHGITKYLK